mgnify:CR=1 FL=1
MDCIPHLTKLGVTAVELLPVFDVDENERAFPAADNDHPLYNYWGYSTIQFSALK